MFHKKNTLTMTITFSENVAASTLERIINYIKLEKVPFAVNKAPEGEEIQWDWSDVDAVSFSKFGLSQIADDWECPEEWAALAHSTAG
jgi:hypothetical protein